MTRSFDPPGTPTRWLAGLILLMMAAPLSAGSRVNTDRKGVAIRGFDPVAYHTTGTPVKGLREYALSWSGATWRFANAENLALFREDPDRYAPQYGGYCAYAMSDGKLVPVDPEVWTIVDDKLYLNYSRKVHAIWDREREARIARADHHWGELGDE